MTATSDFHVFSRDDLTNQTFQVTRSQNVDLHSTCMKWTVLKVMESCKRVVRTACLRVPSCGHQQAKPLKIHALPWNVAGLSGVVNEAMLL